MKYTERKMRYPGGLNHAVMCLIFVLLCLFPAFFFAGCPNPLSPPAEPVAGANTLIVQIGGESPASRTALPSPLPNLVSYNISVTRLGTILGGCNDVGAGSYPIELSSTPAAGDVVLVEGLDASSNKQAEGCYVLPSGYIPGTSVTIILDVSKTGTGNINLAVSFPLGSGGDEITAAEVRLYRSLADYQAGTDCSFKRYRKNTGDYGEGENLASSIPITLANLLSGNYVVQIDFFRFKYVRVSRLVQTIIVRDGLTTNSWDGGSSTLTWGEDKFASSNANLRGITIGGTSVPGFSSTDYAYAISEAVTEAPGTKALTVAGTPGQAIAVSLNGADAGTGRSVPLSMKAVNSIVIAVTAPDGVTKQTYTVSCTYYNQTEWYVKAVGSDGNDGTSDTNAMATIAKVLDAIKSSYSISIPSLEWPGKNSNAPVAARITIIGEINENVTIEEDPGSGDTLPPILLTGSNGGKINSGQPLNIDNATVILEDGLTLTGGNAWRGGGVYVRSGNFIMNGGSISGNTSTANGVSGGGVYVASGSFTMNGGSISDNKTFISALGEGGGVNVSGGSFTMNGGSVSDNEASSDGGGVNVKSGSFIMIGGTISGNQTPYDGAGVYVWGGGWFTMNGGSIRENTVTSLGKGGGGVRVWEGAFTMTGGIISGNSAGADGGGGVYVSDSSAGFTMSGGSIIDNQTGGNGGGVRVENANFTMSGQSSISGNTSTVGNGDGVYFGGNSFTMSKSAVVDTGNMVYLASNKVITLSGPLTANPAANIKVASSYSGLPVLVNDTVTPEDDITLGDNYKKFWLNGASNAAGDKIGDDGKIK
ncbi:MAG: cadherin-like beta sandwich domain-containing protein [Treponema sp.]|jgi:hypothetical protein|nr:cadherin-like beta sandwich domain-containing protein [Treponema sp.]